MTNRDENHSRIDPSNIQQSFDEFQVKIHCCRYWKFSSWCSSDLTAPFWRLYHNEIQGALVDFKDEVLELQPNSIVIIPPNTAYSIYTRNRAKSIDQITGTQINRNDSKATIAQLGMIDHFFIHFNLGILRDHIQPQLFQFQLSQFDLQEIAQIKDHLKSNYRSIPFEITAKIQRLILGGIAQINFEAWRTMQYDKRINKVLSVIHKQLTTTISNANLAEEANMATNSFARLFREQLGISVQQYILKKRLEKSLSLLHHSNLKIEAIAQECGFYDLHHFSRVFKKELGVSPSVYKKQSTMG